MLFSMGYQGRKFDEFIRALKSNGVKILVDVRSKPSSRIASYRYEALKKRMAREGFQYIWWGEHLGGMTSIRERAIKTLADWQGGKVACLMCMERDPDQCHRSYEIARRLEKYDVTVTHIVEFE